MRAKNKRSLSRSHVIPLKWVSGIITHDNPGARNKQGIPLTCSPSPFRTTLPIVIITKEARNKQVVPLSCSPSLPRTTDPLTISLARPGMRRQSFSPAT